MVEIAQALRTPLLLAIAAVLVAEPASAGPPLVADDPFTVGKGRSEIIFASTHESRPQSDVLSAPLFDLTLGLTEQFDLTRDQCQQLLDATHIDRLNLGPVPTIQLNWLQPHEGNIIDFLYRARAFQMAEAS